MEGLVWLVKNSLVGKGKKRVRSIWSKKVTLEARSLQSQLPSLDNPKSDAQLANCVAPTYEATLNLLT